MSLNDLVRSLLGRKPVRLGEVGARAVQPAPAPRRMADRDPLAGIEILPEYEQVRKLLDAGYPALFVTGGAGTGKSTLIRYLDARSSLRMAVIAPTGVAALNAGGMTIHSFCRLPLHLVRPEDVKPPKDRRLVRALDVLVIDEISMVRPDILDAVDLFLRRTRESEAPFGGVSMVLMGDLFQLPPVVKSGEARILREMGYGSDFFFSAKVLSKVDVAPVLLKRVFRQRDPAFVELLADLRVGRRLRDGLERVNARVSPDPPVGGPELSLTSTNDVADRTNARELDSLPGKPMNYEGRVEGKFRANEARLPSPMNLALKVGAQVMFTKNDTNKRWVNGTLGRVVALEAEHLTVEVEKEGLKRRHPVQREKWEEYRYRFDPVRQQIVPEVTGSYHQFPLMLAWAVTIHKAQGKTLDRIMIDLGWGAFASGQVYVALSRVRALEDLRLARPVQEQDVRCDPQVAQFYELMEAASVQPEKPS